MHVRAIPGVLGFRLEWSNVVVHMLSHVNGYYLYKAKQINFGFRGARQHNFIHFGPYHFWKKYQNPVLTIFVHCGTC